MRHTRMGQLRETRRVEKYASSLKIIWWGSSSRYTYSRVDGPRSNRRLKTVVRMDWAYWPVMLLTRGCCGRGTSKADSYNTPRVIYVQFRRWRGSQALILSRAWYITPDRTENYHNHTSWSLIKNRGHLALFTLHIFLWSDFFSWD